MSRKLAVIGVGNMAKAIIAGVVTQSLPISEILLYDKNSHQYKDLPAESSITFRPVLTIADAVSEADCVLLSVKPQNFPEVLSEIAAVEGHEKKLYISIAAGITVDNVSSVLSGACVIRVLPNVPMIIGQGVSVVCQNPLASSSDFEFVCSVFRCAGSVVLIQQEEMNRMIGVTSSSPAYVFQFINAIYQGALAQGLPDRDLINIICDMVIGSALLLKKSSDTPEEWVARVASKGGTTERALEKLKEFQMNDAIAEAMIACTNRADELGEKNK